MLKRVGNRELSGKTEIFIKEASFSGSFQPGLEFNSPVHGNWNIVHTGMLVRKQGRSTSVRITACVALC